MQTPHSPGLTVASALEDAAPDLDVWAWSGDKNRPLDTLLEIKRAVHLHRSLRRRLESHLGDLTDEQGIASNPEVAGLTLWLLAKYGRAYPFLSQVKAPGPAVLYALAECCLYAEIPSAQGRAMRRPDRAASLLEEHPDLGRHRAVFRLRLDALAFDHDRDAVKAALDAAPAALRQSPDGLYFEGRVQEWDGDAAAAVATFESVITEEPDHRGALLRLAFRADLVGDDELAEHYYRRLLAHRPLDSHALLNYGVFLEDRERYQEALALYGQVLEQYPSHRRALRFQKDARGSLDMIFDEDHEKRDERKNRLLRISINDFELSVRARNCLDKMGIKNLGDLVQRTEAELLAYKNFGEGSLNEIKALLENHSLRLGMNLDEDPLPLHPTPKADRAKGQVELPPGVEPSVLGIVLADLELSVRVRRALVQINANTIGELLHHSEAEFLSMKNFGQTSLVELKSRLAEYGVELGSK